MNQREQQNEDIVDLYPANELVDFDLLRNLENEDAVNFNLANTAATFTESELDAEINRIEGSLLNLCRSSPRARARGPSPSPRQSGWNDENSHYQGIQGSLLGGGEVMSDLTSEDEDKESTSPQRRQRSPSSSRSCSCSASESHSTSCSNSSCASLIASPQPTQREPSPAPQPPLAPLIIRKKKKTDNRKRSPSPGPSSSPVNKKKKKSNAKRPVAADADAAIGVNDKKQPRQPRQRPVTAQAAQTAATGVNDQKKPRSVTAAAGVNDKKKPRPVTASAAGVNENRPADKKKPRAAAAAAVAAVKPPTPTGTAPAATAAVTGAMPSSTTITSKKKPLQLPPPPPRAGTKDIKMCNPPPPPPPLLSLAPPPPPPPPPPPSTVPQQIKTVSTTGTVAVSKAPFQSPSFRNKPGPAQVLAVPKENEEFKVRIIKQALRDGRVDKPRPATYNPRLHQIFLPWTPNPTIQVNSQEMKVVPTGLRMSLDETPNVCLAISLIGALAKAGLVLIHPLYLELGTFFPDDIIQITVVNVGKQPIMIDVTQAFCEFRALELKPVRVYEKSRGTSWKGLRD